MKPETRARLCLAWIWLIAAWVLTGAVFKLFWGNPALLPEIVRDLPLPLGTTYNLAIGIELAIVAVALTKPRWGWWLEAALLCVFDFVLTTQLAAGETSCGCFGAKLVIHPGVMMAIDSVLLVGLIALRPWSCLGPGLPPVAPIALAAIALALPWFFDRELQQGEVVADGQPAKGQWVDMRVEDWIGKEIWDTPLGQEPLSRHIDLDQLSPDGLWVFWRATCEHCAKHLEEMAATQHGQSVIVLIQLEEAQDTLANRVVHTLPDGNFVQSARLPASFDYLLQTPAELLLELGKVVGAKEAVTPETSLATKPP